MIAGLYLPLSQEVLLMGKIVLFDEKKNCSGCQACVNICPKNTIKIETDENGFLYPRIEEYNCIECGLCNKVCAFQHEDDSRKTPIEAFAAVNTNEKELEKSASGGVFAALARHILEKGGIVAGCAFVPDGELLKPQHILIDSLDDLEKLQGSKYVMSDTSDIYMQIHKALVAKKPVLFSGTPCQVDAVNGFYSKAQRENLYTVDIVCHGTPSVTMFQDYLKLLSDKKGKPIVDFSFRDKEYSWSKTGSVTYRNEDGSLEKEKIPFHRSSYYNNFQEGNISRDSCYSCKYSGSRRTGDLTLGDFWGIGVEYPEYVKEDFDEKKGISCVLVNSEKGKKLLEEVDGLELKTRPALVEKIIRHNWNLREPSVLHKKEREKIFRTYREQGYAALDAQFQKSLGMKAVARDVWEALPPTVKSKVKKVVRKNAKN